MKKWKETQTLFDFWQSCEMSTLVILNIVNFNKYKAMYIGDIFMVVSSR